MVDFIEIDTTHSQARENHAQQSFVTLCAPSNRIPIRIRNPNDIDCIEWQRHSIRSARNKKRIALTFDYSKRRCSITIGVP